MHTVCRNFATFFIAWLLQGFSTTLPARSLTQRRLCQFLDVVHDAVPLRSLLALEGSLTQSMANMSRPIKPRALQVIRTWPNRGLIWALRSSS